MRPVRVRQYGFQTILHTDSRFSDFRLVWELSVPGSNVDMRIVSHEKEEVGGGGGGGGNLHLSGTVSGNKQKQI